MARTKLPDDFLTGLRESYKYFFYRVLLDERHSSARMSCALAIAKMIQKAWPFVCKHNLLLGNNDHLNILCHSLFDKYESLEVPTADVILEELRNPIYRPNIDDISRVFVRMADAWIGRTSNPDSGWVHSSSYTSTNLFPYFLETVDGSEIICFNDSWISYVDTCDGTETEYEKAFHSFMQKRNRTAFKRYLDSISVVRRAVESSGDVTPVGMSPETFSVLERIPIDFLNREPKIIERNPGLEYLKNNPQPDILYLGDLFKVSMRKRVTINSLKKYVQDEAERLVKAFKYYTELPSIPHDVIPGAPMGYAVRDFIHEYIDRLSERNEFLIPRERERRNVRLKVFSTLYDDRIIVSATRNDLADELGLHPERIRQLQQGSNSTVGIESCSQILQGTMISEDFIVNPFFQADYIDFQASNFQAERQDAFDSKLGLFDDKTRAFLLAVMGLRQTDTIRYIEPFIIKGENITVINKNIASIMKYFNDTLYYVSIEDEVITFMKEQLHLEYEVIDVIVEIIRHSELFECDPFGCEDRFRLKWKHLLTDPARLARILSDAGTPMHFTAVFDEYQRRATACNMDMKSSDELTHFRHPYIKTLGKMGIWEYSEDTAKKKSNAGTLREVIEEFIIDNGGVTNVSAVMNLLESLSLPNNERSIKTYLSSLCWSVRFTDTYVHRSFEHLFEQYNIHPSKLNDSSVVIPSVVKMLIHNGGTGTIRMAVDAYKEETGNSIRETSLRMMLSKFEDIIAYESDGKRVTLRLLIPFSEADKIDYNRMSEIQMPEFYIKIMDSVTNQLEAAPEHCMKLSSALKEALEYVPRDKHKNIVYKIIPRMENVIVYEVDGKKFIRLK